MFAPEQDARSRYTDLQSRVSDGKFSKTLASRAVARATAAFAQGIISTELNWICGEVDTYRLFTLLGFFVRFFVWLCCRPPPCAGGRCCCPRSSDIVVRLLPTRCFELPAAGGALHTAHGSAGRCCCAFSGGVAAVVTLLVGCHVAAAEQQRGAGGSSGGPSFLLPLLSSGLPRPDLDDQGVPRARILHNRDRVRHLWRDHVREDLGHLLCEVILPLRTLEQGMEHSL